MLFSSSIKCLITEGRCDISVRDPPKCQNGQKAASVCHSLLLLQLFLPGQMEEPQFVTSDCQGDMAGMVLVIFFSFLEIFKQLGLSLKLHQDLILLQKSPVFFYLGLTGVSSNVGLIQNKSRIRDTLTLLTCADKSIATKQ